MKVKCLLFAFVALVGISIFNSSSYAEEVTRSVITIKDAEDESSYKEFSDVPSARNYLLDEKEKDSKKQFKIGIDNVNVVGVTKTNDEFDSLDNSFCNCNNLVSANVSGNIAIGSYAFCNCNNLVSANVSGNITIGSFAFCNCKNLKRVEILSGVDKIGESAFANCKNLKNIKIPGSVKKISNGTFYSCDNLSTVVLKDGITEIDKFAFANCTKLVTVSMPKSVNFIGPASFWNCKKLIKIRIPNGASVCLAAFYGCNKEWFSIPDDIKILSGIDGEYKLIDTSNMNPKDREKTICIHLFGNSLAN